MSTAHTKIFTSNRSQAVRLPKNVAFPESVKEIDIVAIGNKRLIIPAGGSWDSWFEALDVTDDFMAEREQPADQIREEF